jgi:hypothetical protein
MGSPVLFIFQDINYLFYQFFALFFISTSLISVFYYYIPSTKLGLVCFFLLRVWWISLSYLFNTFVFFNIGTSSNKLPTENCLFCVPQSWVCGIFIFTWFYELLNFLPGIFNDPLIIQKYFVQYPCVCASSIVSLPLMSYFLPLLHRLTWDLFWRKSHDLLIIMCILIMSDVILHKCLLSHLIYSAV